MTAATHPARPPDPPAPDGFVPDRSAPEWLVLLLGVAALAAAMGIGRFAFTPLLPLMLRDGALDPAAGAAWAAANYGGYLVGALTARWPGRRPARGLGWSLLGVAAATLGAALPGPDSGPVGPLLRAAAGVFSAWALICASAALSAELARRRALPRLAWIYCGVGVGIAASGTLGWLGGWQPARWLWLELGILAALVAAAVALGLRRLGAAAPARAAPVAAAPAGAPSVVPAGASDAATTAVPAPAGAAWPLALCYGAFGFGYIVPATFLPALARERVSDPLVFGLAWPLFGLAAALSVAACARWLPGWPRRRVWALAQAVMAVGAALPAISGALPALAASAVLVGGTFMVATMAGLQLARELRPAEPTPLLARMTVAFALGQIAGPLLVRALDAATGGAGVAWASAVAAAVLGLSAAWLWRGGAAAG